MDFRYKAVRSVARLLCISFCRRVEVVGLENVPANGGGVLVSWHPNGVIDPGIILAAFPRRITFGARDGLFRVPGFSMLLRAVGAVPIHRAQDTASQMSPEARRAANVAALDRLAEAVAAGGFSCLFPEGDSHDHPYLLELKTGAARFFYRACSLSEPSAPSPVLLPVGLHYDAKDTFRSHVLVEFHPPIALPPELQHPRTPGEPMGARRDRVDKLTDELDRVLREVVHATESWEDHNLMHRVRKLLRAERARRVGARLSRPGMKERQLAFARVWDGVRRLQETDPDALTVLQERVTAYSASLDALGLEDHELDRGPSVLGPFLALVALAKAAAVFLLMPPLLLFGLVAHLPAFGLLWAVSTRAARRRKDIASIKLLFGAVLLLGTWIGVGFTAASADRSLQSLLPLVPHSSVTVGLLAVALSILGGGLAVRYVRLVGETVHALQVRLTRSRRRSSVRRLRADRAAIADAIEAASAALTLPGRVSEDGRVLPGRPDG